MVSSQLARFGNLMVNRFHCVFVKRVPRLLISFLTMCFSSWTARSVDLEGFGFL